MCKKYDKEFILNVLKDKYKQHRRRLDNMEINNLERLPNVGVIKKLFSKNISEIWQDIEEEFGIEPKKRKIYTIEELNQILKTKTNDLGRIPEHMDLDFTVVSCLKKYFGTFTNALHELGYRKKDNQK